MLLCSLVLDGLFTLQHYSKGASNSSAEQDANTPTYTASFEAASIKRSHYTSALLLANNGSTVKTAQP
jgi:hypothetical protein